MKSIREWRDLEQLGINYLTAESCGLSMRLLCDVNQKGKETVEAFLRCSLTSENWNSKVNGEPAVASVMLTRGVLDELAAFAWIYQTGNPARLSDRGVICMEHTDSVTDFERVERCYPGRWIGESNHPGNGIDNTHAMSGRQS